MGNFIFKKNLWLLITFAISPLLMAPSTSPQKRIVRPSSSGISPIKAFVNKTIVAKGESLTLTISHIGNAKHSSPDLSPLTEFKILSSSQSSETSIINGRLQKKVEWTYEILPTGDKKVIIPPLNIGKYKTGRIVIEINNNRAKNINRDLTLSAKVDQKETYVSAQIILTLRLETTQDLRSGALDEPVIEGAIVEPFGKEDDRVEIIDGIKHSIFERKYAIFAKNIGKITIPPIAFSGSVIGEQKNTRNSWPGFFTTTKRVGALSNSISVKIKEKPAAFPANQPWLAVKNLALIETFESTTPKFEIDKATTRNFEIRAVGALSSFIPRVPFKELNNANIYAEVGQKINEASPDGITASVKESHVYMPTDGGKLEIPEQKIYWWDTINDELRVATVRSHSSKIIGMPKPKPPAQPTIINPQPTPKPIVQKILQPTNSSTKNNLLKWKVIAVSFAALWLVTFILLIRARFLRKEISSTLKSGPQNLLSNDDNLKTQLRNLKENLKKNNAKNSYSDWQKIVNLLSKNYEGSNHFNELIKNKNLEKQINLLSLALYKKDKAGSDWQGHNMLAALKNVLDSIEKNSHKEKQLPPLYPQ